MDPMGNEARPQMKAMFFKSQAPRGSAHRKQFDEDSMMRVFRVEWWDILVGSVALRYTLQGTNISPKNGILKMIFLFPRWDMLIPWRVYFIIFICVCFQYK